MTIWQDYISAYRSMLPMKIEGSWANWEGKGTYLNAITHSHPHFIKSRQVDISDGKNVADSLNVKDIDFCKRLVDWGDIIRKTFYDGGIEEIISTRRLVHILRAYSIFKNKAKAIQVCVNRFDDETKQAFLELYDKVDADFNMDNNEAQN